MKQYQSTSHDDKYLWTQQQAHPLEFVGLQMNSCGIAILVYNWLVLRLPAGIHSGLVSPLCFWAFELFCLVLPCTCIMLCHYKGITYFTWDRSPCCHPVILLPQPRTANSQPLVRLLKKHHQDCLMLSTQCLNNLQLVVHSLTCCFFGNVPLLHTSMHVIACDSVLPCLPPH